MLFVACADNPRIVRQSSEPNFVWDNPRIVPIRTLRMAYNFIEVGEQSGLESAGMR